jgi:hypothetical protein
MEELINDIAEELHISVPKIVYVDKLDTETKMAAVDDDTVYIKNGLHQIDQIYAVAHEMRHMWQKRYDKNLLKDHGNSKDVSLEEYNLHPAEVDANAYAYIVCCDCGMEPLLKELSETVRKAIAKRVAEIYETL